MESEIDREAGVSKLRQPPSRRRVGLRREPEGGWPLDRLLVGTGTLRTARELLRLASSQPGAPQRAWDIALWSGVTPQGTTLALERLVRAGLVRRAFPGLPGRRPGQAPTPGAHPLADLFRAEKAMARREAGGGRT